MPNHRKNSEKFVLFLGRSDRLRECSSAVHRWGIFFRKNERGIECKYHKSYKNQKDLTNMKISIFAPIQSPDSHYPLRFWLKNWKIKQAASIMPVIKNNLKWSHNKYHPICYFSNLSTSVHQSIIVFFFLFLLDIQIHHFRYYWFIIIVVFSPSICIIRQGSIFV